MGERRQLYGLLLRVQIRRGCVRSSARIGSSNRNKEAALGGRVHVQPDDARITSQRVHAEYFDPLAAAQCSKKGYEV
jgi:hypothetical protein